MFLSSLERPPLGEYAKVFSLAFLPFFLVISLAFAYLSERDRQVALDKIRTNERTRVGPAAQLLNRDFDAVLSDLMILAHADELARYLQRPEGAERERVARLFALFSREKRIYDQIRYLDDSGKERIRVDFRNGRPRVAPQQELQDKAGRYYFTESYRLTAGTVFVSPLDLNVERGQVEVPYKPMLRFATPVFDAAGRHRGIVLVNYLAGDLLERVRAHVTGDANEAMLLDSDGYWMFGPQPDKEWGRDLKNGASFARDYPQAWELLRQQTTGQQIIGDALFTFHTVMPLTGSYLDSRHEPNDIAFHSLNGGPRGYRWYLLSYIPPLQLDELVTMQRHDYLPFYLFAVLLLLVLAASYAYVRVHQRHAERNMHLAAMVMDVTRDGVLIADENRNVVSINHAYSALSGRTRMDVLGKDLRDIHRDCYDEEHCARIWQGVAQEESWQGEVWLRRKNGDFVPLVSMLGVAVDERRTRHNYVEIMSDISTLKSREQSLQRLAYHDALTGLPNRYLFEDRLQMAIAAAARHGSRVAVVFIDLDEFKPINDQYGHDAGDAVLKEVGQRLRNACLRSNDTVARLGGDEFAVILQNIELAKTVEELVRRLHLALSAPLMLPCGELTIRASIGYSLYPDAGLDAGDVVKAADQAMYREKLRTHEDAAVH